MDDGVIIFLIGLLVWIIYGVSKAMSDGAKEKAIKRETEFGYAEREDNKAKYDKLAESRWPAFLAECTASVPTLLSTKKQLYSDMLGNEHMFLKTSMNHLKTWRIC